MKSEDNKKNLYLRIVFIVIIVVISFFLIFKLLQTQMINGDNFVVLSLGIIVLGIVGFLLPNIEQFSFGEFKMKFKEMENEADRILEELKKAQIDSYRVMLKLIGKQTKQVGDSNAIKDFRLDDFWDIVASIESHNYESYLRSELLEIAKKIKNGQFFVIKNFIDLDNQYRNEDSRTIMRLALESYPDYENKKHQGLSNQQKKEKKQKLIDAIDVYRKIEDYIKKIFNDHTGSEL